MARRNRADRDGDRKQGGLIAERLARLRRRARFVLWLEALSLAALAPLGVIAAWLIVVLLGFGGLAADIAGIVLLVAAAIWSVRRFRAPEPPAIDARIERASGFRHRPIAAIEDHPAPLGPEGIALWFVYRDKLDRLLRHARVGLPSPDLASRDPLALRALLLLGLIAAAIVAGPEAGSRLGAAIALPRLAFGPPERVAAWITPPAWTGEAPLLVSSDAKHVTALAGATLSLIVTHGGGSAPPVAIGGKAVAARRLGDHSYRARTVLHDGGRVVVGPFWNRAAAFRIDLLPETQPSVAFAGTPAPDRNGRRLGLAWTADSDYGLASLALRLEPTANRHAPADTHTLPAPASRRGSMKGKASLDLTSSPFAGLPVDGTLVARNHAGLSGTSDSEHFTLPAPRLTNGTARMLQALRQHLALFPNSRGAVADALEHVALMPPGPIANATDLQIAVFAGALAANGEDAAHPLARLWDLVQQAERGPAARSAQALAEARKALETALEKAMHGKTLDQQRLEHLLNALRAAESAHIAALRKLASPSTQSQDAEQNLNTKEIEKLARQIANEARQGDRQAAEHDMQRLRAMLQALQNARPMTAQDAAQLHEMNALRQQLQKILHRQANLLNRTQHQSAQQAPIRQTPLQPGTQGQPSPSAPNSAMEGLAAQQRQLRQALGKAQARMAHSGLPGQGQLGKSAKSMHDAETRLSSGNGQGAIPAQQAAISALQKASRALSTMRLGSGQSPGSLGLGAQGPGGGGRFGNANRERLKSLGRKNGTSRARAIEDELLKRDAEPGLGQPAHHYYRRLLGAHP